MNTIEAIRTKRAVREFDGRAISPDDRNAIIDAGRHAQSAMNKQPWHFLAVTDRAMLEKLAEVSGWAGHLKSAGMGVLLLINSSDWAKFDSGQAAAYMQLAAWDLGISSCLGGFVDPSKARELLGWPADLELLISISFGYAPADHVKQSAKKGGRRPLDEVVHWEKW